MANDVDRDALRISQIELRLSEIEEEFNSPFALRLRRQLREEAAGLLTELSQMRDRA